MEYIQFIVTIIIILVIFYIANYAKRKQDKELKKMQDDLKEGDKIVTYSGMAGIVSKVLEDRIILKTYPNEIEISIEKWAVAGLDDRTIEDEKEDSKKVKNKENKKENKHKKPSIIIYFSNQL